MSDTRPFASLPALPPASDLNCCAKEDYDLLIAADEPEIEQAATSLRGAGTRVDALQSSPPLKG